MSLDEQWITEICEDGGSAFALRGRDKVFEQQSPFQKVEVFDTTTYGKLMLIDGCTMVSTRDNFLYHEMMSHPVLFSHPAPKRVAIIGGGDCGTLREVLKHPEVERGRESHPADERNPYPYTFLELERRPPAAGDCG
jgi:spermidine synthase